MADYPRYGEKSEKVEAFIRDLIEVYKKHGLSLSHEDSHGSFIVESYDEYNVNWLKGALVDTRAA